MSAHFSSPFCHGRTASGPNRGTGLCPIESMPASRCQGTYHLWRGRRILEVLRFGASYVMKHSGWLSYEYAGRSCVACKHGGSS